MDSPLFKTLENLIKCFKILADIQVTRDTIAEATRAWKGCFNKFLKSPLKFSLKIAFDNTFFTPVSHRKMPHTKYAQSSYNVW